MGLPRRYRKARKPIASFDYSEILSGQAYETYYLGNTHQAATTYKMSGVPWDSYEILTTVTNPANAGVLTKELDLDYDIDVKKAMTVFGDAIFNMTIGQYNNAGAGQGIQIKVKLIHYDGSTETDIGGGQLTSESCLSAGNDYKDLRVAMTFDVSTKQIFKKGDTLRINIEVWAYGPVGASHPNNCLYIANDPGNKDTELDRIWLNQSGVNPNSFPTRAAIYIPFIVQE